jgi:hypothetical protein
MKNVVYLSPKIDLNVRQSKKTFHPSGSAEGRCELAMTVDLTQQLLSIA